ncbi:YitT family protein [Metabacillus litoralis]|uniref:YitT family protein n=1 Tax=Metabacillus litoralis TaxID=152268 RepID=A0A5C6W172_9BACI|nr:YitT family protein [Metabacillus litoralis]TXC90051.1 YitT family protein [Metabacillus litoralis]
MANNMTETIFKWVVYFIGLLIMSLGIVLTIKAELGVSSWDVLHIGLYYQFGLTIGSWTIITGVFVLLIATILMKRVPQLGAFINMITIGIFIDLYLLLPFLHTPHSFLGQLLMLLIGIVVLCYGMGLYISAKCGAGPRDSLMMALVEKTGKSITVIRGSIEIIVLFFGWLLGGPVFIGTIITTLSLGYMAGVMIPFCEKSTDKLFSELFKQNKKIFEKVC